MTAIVRSALFAPGIRPARFAKALVTGADAVIVDFEDAVEDHLKEQARQNLADFLQQQPDAKVWVRINGAGHPEQAADLAFCAAQAGIAGVLLPKAETAEQVQTATAIGKPVWALIENAKGLLAVPAMAACPGLQRLSFGGLDLGLDIGMANGTPTAAMVYDQIRLTLLLHSRVNGLQPPLDTVYPAFDDAEGFTANVRHCRDMGLVGGLCIHPKQVAVMHEALKPAESELDWARRVVEASKSGAAAYQVDGQMVDAPVLGRARRILAMVGE